MLCPLPCRWLRSWLAAHWLWRRLLPLLPTHLTLAEISERLLVSRNTVKTQAISIYHKLGVSSRSQTVARMYDLGLAVQPETPHFRR